MASGLAKRFGDNKLLINFNGKPLVEHIMETLEKIEDLNYEKILVYRNEEVKNLGKKYGFKLIENEKYYIGQSESLKCGINATSIETEGYMFFVADQPFVSCETVLKVAKEGLKKDGIVMPVKGNRRGNPVFFSARFKDDLLALTRDEGGKKVINNNLDSITYVEIDNKYEFFDIDTKEDLEKSKDLIMKYKIRI